LRPDPDPQAYQNRLDATYRARNYGSSLAARMMRRGHMLLERDFDTAAAFPTVLEVGAGTGEHLPHVRHQFDEYFLTDLNPVRLADARASLPAETAARVTIASEDATRLKFGDASVDRLIACHILEHLPSPHLVLREWHRVVRPGGVLSILLPCDPGLLWRTGRALGPRAAAERVGIEYDYWMAREHVNSIGNLVTLIRYYFDKVHETWFPAALPSVDLNLFYLCQIRRH
jgi:ubiquinone/menaquinone biosynthesis C-methylase UbiE